MIITASIAHLPAPSLITDPSEIAALKCICFPGVCGAHDFRFPSPIELRIIGWDKIGAVGSKGVDIFWI
jgi:hypothetical protein